MFGKINKKTLQKDNNEIKNDKIRNKYILTIQLYQYLQAFDKIRQIIVKSQKDNNRTQKHIII